jgi:hypothetical protein
MTTLDTRIVYGARCGWWGSIDEVAATASGLPCCPYCHGVLFEVDSEETWWAGARVYEAEGHPGYVAFLEQNRGEHFPTINALLSAYEESCT